MGLLTLTFDLLTLKLVCTSHLRLGTSFLPNLGMLGLSVLELFAMYATDGQTDRRTDKSNACCPSPTVGAQQCTWALCAQTRFPSSLERRLNNINVHSVSKGHSRSSAMRSFATSSRLSLNGTAKQAFSDNNSWNDLQGRSRSLAMAVTYHFLLVVGSNHNYVYLVSLLKYSTLNNGKPSNLSQRSLKVIDNDIIRYRYAFLSVCLCH